MSHFTVLVVGVYPEEQLARYDEQIEVERYSTGVVNEENKQRFINYYTKKDAYSKISEHLTFENAVLSFDELYEKYGDDWNNNSWEKNENGEWEEYSTYNPDSKWDWYSLGGRWSGLIQLKEGAAGEIGNPGAFNNEVGIDQARKGDIANFDELKTFALVKDGVWYERGQMGWWACVSNEKADEEWDEEYRKLLEGLPDDTLISVFDCHI